jgi:hypothetical protein
MEKSSEELHDLDCLRGLLDVPSARSTRGSNAAKAIGATHRFCR